MNKEFKVGYFTQTEHKNPSSKKDKSSPPCQVEACSSKVAPLQHLESQHLATLLREIPASVKTMIWSVSLFISSHQ